MILFAECLIACLIFEGIFVGGVLFRKEAFFREYSPAVQQKYLELHPDFKIPEEKVTPGLLAAKIGMCLFFLLVLTVMAYFAGARSFRSGFCCSYLIWTVVNLFDVVVLDLLVFMKWKRVRLEGTEDMDAEYKQNVIPSIKGGIYGVIIGLPVCLLCGLILRLI